MLSFIVVEDFRMLIQPYVSAEMIGEDGSGSCSGRIPNLHSTDCTTSIPFLQTKLLLSA